MICILYMDLTIPLLTTNLLKYPYNFWKLKSKIKKNNDNSQKCVELYPPAARSTVKKLYQRCWVVKTETSFKQLEPTWEVE